MIDAQIAYFPYADKAYELLDKQVANDPYISSQDEAARLRYTNAIREYFTKRIITESTSGAVFDEQSYINEVKERIKDSAAREALVMKGESVSSEEYASQRDVPGQLNEKDLERAILTTRKKDLVKKYNALDQDERKLFALALYASNLTQTGSQKSRAASQIPSLLKSL